MKKYYTVITYEERNFFPRVYYIEVLPCEDITLEMDFRFGVQEDEIFCIFEGHHKNLKQGE